MVVEMRDRMVEHAKLRRGHTPFELVTAKHNLPGTPGPGPARAGLAAAEDQITQDVDSQFHRLVSASQSVDSFRDVLALLATSLPA
jgi:hypothetical protein